MDFSVPQAAATAALNLSLAWIVGILAARFWLSSSNEPWTGEVRGNLRITLIAAGIFGLIAALFSLWSEAAAMAEVPFFDAGPAFFEMLKSTHYGHAGIVVMVSLVLISTLQSLSLGSTWERFWLVIPTVLICLAAAARVSIGHAFEHGPFSLAVAIEYLHLLMMSLWAGSVLVSARVVLPAFLVEERTVTTTRIRYLNALSDWATVALVVILISGFYNGYRVLGKVDNLTGSDYGYVVLAKVALVFVAAAMGGFNKFFGLPHAVSLSTSPEQSHRALKTVTKILQIESVVLTLVIIAAALLTTNAPPV